MKSLPKAIGDSSGFIIVNYSLAFYHLTSKLLAFVSYQYRVLLSVHGILQMSLDGKNIGNFWIASKLRRHPVSSLLVQNGILTDGSTGP